MYQFTKLAIELNEEEPGVAPTDSRNRPDQRVMEQGDFDKANMVKEGRGFECFFYLCFQRSKRNSGHIGGNVKRKSNRRCRKVPIKLIILLNFVISGLSYPEYSPKWFEKTQVIS